MTIAEYMQDNAATHTGHRPAASLSRQVDRGVSFFSFRLYTEPERLLLKFRGP